MILSDENRQAIIVEYAQDLWALTKLLNEIFRREKELAPGLIPAKEIADLADQIREQANRIETKVKLLLESDKATGRMASQKHWEDMVRLFQGLQKEGKNLSKNAYILEHSERTEKSPFN